MRRTIATATGWTAFIFAVYLFLGFRPAPPQTIGEGEICFRCRGVIANSRVAAEMMDRNLPTKYKTAGCLARYVKAHPADNQRYFVTDYVSGGLIDAGRAWFVPVLLNDRTGHRDYKAFLSRQRAESLAASLGETAVRWETVLERAEP
jgi:hypothetical protein